MPRTAISKTNHVRCFQETLAGYLFGRMALLAHQWRIYGGGQGGI